jgi:hypothetical protein
MAPSKNKARGSLPVVKFFYFICSYETSMDIVLKPKLNLF